MSPGARSRPGGGGSESTNAATDVSPSVRQGEDAAANVTPKTPAERAREYRQRKRDALTEALVTPSTVTPVTPNVTIQPITSAAGMTKGERDELAKITRQRGRVAKAQIEAVKAELTADVEAKLSAEFSARAEMWGDAVKIAKQAISDANAEIARVCDERGIPADFRPGIQIQWLSRGSNAEPARRAELRKLAAARIDQIGKAAKLTIEAQEADTLAALYAGGLTSDAARQFLERMPDPRTLMPAFDLAELDGRP